MKKSIILFILVALGLSSCEDEVQQTIEGSWSIDTIYYKGQDIRVCLLPNVINFFEENICDIPNTDSSCGELIVPEEEGTWEVIKLKNAPLQMSIESRNKIFSGQHTLLFKKDEPNKLLKMELRSDSLFLVARKGLFYYEGNLKTINKLVKMSDQ